MTIEELRKEIEAAVKPTEFRSTPTERFGVVLNKLVDYIEELEAKLAEKSKRRKKSPRS